MHAHRRGIGAVLLATVAACSPAQPGAAAPGSGRASATVSPRPSTMPAAPSPSATAVASAEDPILAYGGSDVPHPAGVYRATVFRQPFTAVVSEDLGIRDSGDTETLVYIGQDKNATNGDEEFTAMILTRVFDPQDQRSLVDMPQDVRGWFDGHTRLSAVPDTAVTLTVDGLPATQADYLPTDLVVCGPWHAERECVLIGYGPPGDEPFIVFGVSRLRVVVVAHADGPVVFAYQHLAEGGAFDEHVGVFDGWVRSVDFE